MKYPNVDFLSEQKSFMFFFCQCDSWVKNEPISAQRWTSLISSNYEQ